MGKKIKWLCDNPECLNAGNQENGELPDSWLQVGYKRGGKFHPAAEFCSLECMAKVYRFSAAEPEVEPSPAAQLLKPPAPQPKEAANPQSSDAFWGRWHQANQSDRLAIVESVILPLAKAAKKRDFLRQASVLVNSCLSDLAGYLGRLYTPKG